MAKLQLNIEDNVNNILDKLSRRSDKALFVEIAIKKAYQNKSIRELFTWIDENDKQNTPTTKKQVTKTETGKKKPKFDSDFD